MLTITLQGSDAEEYLLYRNTLKSEPSPPVTAIEAAAPTITRTTRVITPTSVSPIPVVQPKQVSVNELWKERIVTKNIPPNRTKRAWLPEERAFLLNAVNKSGTDYSITTLATYLNRTEDSVIAAAYANGCYVRSKQICKDIPSVKEVNVS